LTGCSPMRLAALEYSKKNVKQSDARAARQSAALVARQSDAKSSSFDCRSPLSLYSLPAIRVILTPHVSLARSLARATSRKSWGSNSEVEPARPLERRKSLATSFLAPLRNTFRSSQGARPTSELALCSSESGHSLPSSDRASLSGLSNHASPSTPNLSPTSPGPALAPPSSKRRWTASGHRAQQLTDPWHALDTCQIHYHLRDVDGICMSGICTGPATKFVLENRILSTLL